jgi:hypothetical protein
MAAGEEAVVPNAMEAVWQGLQQEAADGLVGVYMTFALSWRR